MAVSSERNEDLAFPRPLPRPFFFAWALWVGVCGLAYWTYFEAARGRASVLLSIGFWAFAVVVIPLTVRRNRERTASIVAATLALLVYVLLMQSAMGQMDL
jgi:hypothetical protein